MSIIVASKRKKIETLKNEFPACEIIDLTSKAEHPWVMFSPFYPHGDIPVPFSSDMSQTVEGVWQALKVFETADVDKSKIYIKNMKGIKRTVRKYGKVLGHRKGFEGAALLSYLDARKEIYLPTYLWVLENCLQNEISELVAMAKRRLVLLDYETNGNLDDLSKPLSHAHIVKQYIESYENT